MMADFSLMKFNCHLKAEVQVPSQSCGDWVQVLYDESDPKRRYVSC